jgi:membrane-associated phospholipid phosphatase
MDQTEKKQIGAHGESSLKKTTSTATVGLASLAGFVIVTGLVVSGSSQNIDLQAARMVNSFDLGLLGTSLMVLLTKYGREVVWGLLVIVMFLLGGNRTKLLAMELAVLFVAGIIVGDIAKMLVDRLRPYAVDSSIILRVPPETDSSYPSGHALIVSIGASFCIARFRRRVLAILLAAEAALVCYSRVYVGVHYPLDVVGGILLGTSIALIGASLVERYLWSILGKLLEPISMILKNGPLDV